MFFAKPAGFAQKDMPFLRFRAKKVYPNNAFAQAGAHKGLESSFYSYTQSVFFAQRPAGISKVLCAPGQESRLIPLAQYAKDQTEQVQKTQFFVRQVRENPRPQCNLFKRNQALGRKVHAVLCASGRRGPNTFLRFLCVRSRETGGSFCVR